MIVMVVNDFVTRINRQRAYAAESSYGRAVPEPLSAHETIGKIPCFADRLAVTVEHSAGAKLVGLCFSSLGSANHEAQQPENHSNRPMRKDGLEVAGLRTSFAARNDVPDIGVQPTLRSAVGETSRSSATLDASPSSWWSPVLAQTCPFRSAKDDHPAAVPPTPFTPGTPPRNTPPPPQITITTTTIADSCSASLACLGVTKVSSSTDISLYQTAH
ncbi:hypothetical protein CCUS01_10094 [Colletotrichum cuscutae]|uniref:Uncharacterized protein n=1 Tax=Colletotrichum cuscutae TaxID=1209917 RepID=A0AAI9UG27_9PEZI|nr:hypothetical protein CCUS01_10094 [Colletotrichum cuscutae]